MKREPIFWDRYFLGMADYVATASKDPSTKVGAVVVRPDKTVVSMGYNGFPRGVDDSEERLNDRPTKYAFVCHAEANAIVTATEKLAGCTIYVTPLHPCGECAKLIIQSGIKRVVTRPQDAARWQSSFDVAKTMLGEAEVALEIVADDPVNDNVCKHAGGLSYDPANRGIVCNLCGENLSRAAHSRSSAR